MDYRGSHTPENIRDLWQTPRWLFNAVNKNFNFSCDIAASDINHLCRKYITQEMDAFSYDFKDLANTFVWCNPPYSDVGPWIDLAIKNREEHQIGTVLLVPADTSVKWFGKVVDQADEVTFITEGRVSFVRADTQEPFTGNTKGSMLVFFSKEKTNNLKTFYVDRDYIKSEGTDENE